MQTIEHEVHQVFESHVKNYKSLLQLLFSVSETRQQKNVYHVSGKTKMLNQPEFLSLDKVREYLEMIERENQLTEIVKHQKSGLSISIGKENNISFLEDYSLVTATYGSSKSNQGTIAILGPTRMEYAKVVPLLNYFSHMLTEILNKRE